MRTIYVARHGQVGDPECIYAPTGEISLTPLGVEQAIALGRYLQSIGFTGRIYASTMYRALQTGSLVAAQLSESSLIAEHRMQEFAPPKEETARFSLIDYGLKPSEMPLVFPELTVPETTPYPWRVSNENTEQRNQRVSAMLADLLATTQGDALFIGHGASIVSLRVAMKLRGAPDVDYKDWNCSLLSFELDETDHVVSSSVLTEKYLSPIMMTTNFVNPKVPRPDDKRYSVS